MMPKFPLFLVAMIAVAGWQIAPALAQAPEKAPVAANADPASPFVVPALLYGYDALAPVIDAETMRLHHDKHHQAYVDKLNDAVKKDKALQGLTLEQLLSNVSTYDQTVRDNAGGHYNHSLFWTLMTPAGTKENAPSAALLAQINKDFGSLDKFQTAFDEAGTKRFGSGWVWLIWTGDKLAITSTPNQDNPLMDDAVVTGKPVLANDVWEHAYYLTYRNKRADYLKAWWKIVNWTTVNRLFDQAKSGGATN